MRTAARERFVSNIHLAHNAMAGVQEAFSKVGVGAQDPQKVEDQSDYEEFIVGESVVGGKFKVGAKPIREDLRK